MAATVQQTLIPLGTIDADGAYTDDAFGLPGGSEEYIMSVIVSSLTDGSYTTKMQHTPDGTNWVDIPSFTTSAMTTNSIQIVTSTENILGTIRAVITASAVTTGADVKVLFNYRNNHVG